MISQTDAEADQFRISVVVSELESAREVLTTLNDADVTVRPEALEITDVARPRSNLRVDLSDVTIKQWQALELAHERGYYDRPRHADLSELAGELAISKSAVSQRLRSAEARIVDAVVNATE